MGVRSSVVFEYPIAYVTNKKKIRVSRLTDATLQFCLEPDSILPVFVSPYDEKNSKNLQNILSLRGELKYHSFIYFSLFLIDL